LQAFKSALKNEFKCRFKKNLQNLIQFTENVFSQDKKMPPYGGITHGIISTFE